jgi:hypothetical protein
VVVVVTGAGATAVVVKGVDGAGATAMVVLVRGAEGVGDSEIAW